MERRSIDSFNTPEDDMMNQGERESSQTQNEAEKSAKTAALEALKKSIEQSQKNSKEPKEE